MNTFFYRYEAGPEFGPEIWAEIQSAAKGLNESRVYVRDTRTAPYIRVKREVDEAYVIGELALAKKSGQPSAWPRTVAPEESRTDFNPYRLESGSADANRLEDVRDKSNYRAARGILLACCICYPILSLFKASKVMSMMGVARRGQMATAMKEEVFIAVISSFLVAYLVYAIGRAILDAADLAFQNHLRLSESPEGHESG